MPDPDRAPHYAHVLVPLDGSDLAAAAVDTAQALADRFGAELHAVTVADSQTGVADRRRAVAASIAGRIADERLHAEVDVDAAAAILRRADMLGSCLVCTSTHGRGRIAGALVGSVARTVFERGAGPIVAVGPNADRFPPFMSHKPDVLSANEVVACVDGSDASEEVIPVAAAWARALGMALTALTVAEPVQRPVRADAPWRRRHGPDGDAEEYMAAVAARWKDAAPELRTAVVYDPISPTEGVMAYTREHPAGLIALTTHARRGLDRVRFGAAAAGMVHASRSPALVVPLARAGRSS